MSVPVCFLSYECCRMDYYESERKDCGSRQKFRDKRMSKESFTVKKTNYKEHGVPGFHIVHWRNEV